MHIIETIQNHRRPPISPDKEQVESPTEKVTFLQEFLEGYWYINGGGSKDVEGLESRIADAAYEAEDVIESHTIDQMEASTIGHGQLSSVSSTCIKV
ncbi:hypothetical protein PHJA_000422200 [Phtheirospermum japonicum]|uniref:Uncharacterized protein n=1 Tax=Phtheirospermum japonicum TaxID=374723 RepID=A0A830BL28_9LAMI|nr:hypothetical protein PHJA_000422200 [Phtheirospermum japonicum]